ncbi:MAG: TonB family protein [Bacteroidia bacterium]|nr:TonB family protein [Bacteroidia bacterium]
MKYIIALIGINFTLFAQDTTYFNSKSKRCIKDSADYYRVIVKHSDNDFDVTFFYMSGVKKSEGHYRYLNPEFKLGKFTYYSENGAVTAVKNFNSQEHGKSVFYFPNGKIKSIINYNQGKRIDTTFTFYETGELKRYQLYLNEGNEVQGKVFTKSGNDTVFYPYEEGAKHSFNEKDYYELWYKHLIYPKEARKDGFRGEVVVFCIVNEFGVLENATVYKSTHKFLEENALDFIKKIPKWIPARYDGVPIKSIAKLVIPFRFR